MAADPGALSSEAGLERFLAERSDRLTPELAEQLAEMAKQALVSGEWEWAGIAAVVAMSIELRLGRAEKAIEALLVSVQADYQPASTAADYDRVRSALLEVAERARAAGATPHELAAQGLAIQSGYFGGRGGLRPGFGPGPGPACPRRSSQPARVALVADGPCGRHPGHGAQPCPARQGYLRAASRPAIDGCDAARAGRGHRRACSRRRAIIGGCGARRRHRRDRGACPRSTAEARHGRVWSRGLGVACLTAAYQRHRSETSSSSGPGAEAVASCVGSPWRRQLRQALEQLFACRRGPACHGGRSGVTGSR
jgi:hypothetical protein